jgi:hypothetical protein
MRAFRKLSIAEPVLIELREWSRIDEELKVEHSRHTNRLKQQLWRYYPQMLELADDVGASWFLDLFEIPKSHRIRRFDAAHVLAELRKPALEVAPGTIDLIIHAAGINADYGQNLLERHFRDIHVAVQHAAGVPAHMQAGGKALLGLRPDDPGW